MPAGVIEARRDQPLYAQLAHVGERHRRAGRVVGLNLFGAGRAGAYPLTACRGDSHLANEPLRAPIKTDFTRLIPDHRIHHSAAETTTLGLLH
jgi:hypothetical protein